MHSFCKNHHAPAKTGICRLVAALILAALPVALHAQAPVIQAYTQVRNAANLVVEADGTVRPTDIGTQLLQALMAEAGLEYELNLAPWARNIQALETQPNVLAYTLVRTAEREDAYHWIGLVQRIDSYLYGLRRREASLPTTLAEARNYRTASIRDDAYDNLLRSLNFTDIVYINNASPWLTLMERGRMDLIPYSEQAMADYLERQGIAADRVVPLVRLEALSTGLYFALSKQTELATVERLQAAYQQLISNGRYQQITGDPHPTQLNP